MAVGKHCETGVFSADGVWVTQGRCLAFGEELDKRKNDG